MVAFQEFASVSDVKLSSVREAFRLKYLNAKCKHIYLDNFCVIFHVFGPMSPLYGTKWK